MVSDWLSSPRRRCSGLALWAFRPAADVQVTTAAVTTGPIVRRVVATGTLQAETTVEVGTEVSGVVQSLAADYNSLVHAGQVVAPLDPATYVAQLHVAEAAHAQTQAALLRAQTDVLEFQTEVEDAQTKLTRAEALAAKQIISPVRSRSRPPRLGPGPGPISAAAEATVAQAEAAIAQAEAAVEQAEINIEHTGHPRRFRGGGGRCSMAGRGPGMYNAPSKGTPDGQNDNPGIRVHRRVRIRSNANAQGPSAAGGRRRGAGRRDEDASGLASKVITPGTGKAHPDKADLVTVHYTGWTTDGKMFDSSVAAGKAGDVSARPRHRRLDRRRAADGGRRKAPVLDSRGARLQGTAGPAERHAGLRRRAAQVHPIADHGAGRRQGGARRREAHRRAAWPTKS